MTAPPPFTAACIQLCSGRDIPGNLHAVDAAIRAAAADGAQLILTPENTAFMEGRTDPLFAAIAAEKDDTALMQLRTLAAELNIWLLIGSLAVRVGRRRAANRSFLIGPDGGVCARYDKIHMFDVDLPGGESYRESRNYRPGEHMVTADLPWGRIGLTICYDLRFPLLYRILARHGVHFITVPSAFTRQTGAAHWHVLLRARAIETGAFVFAPAQAGDHDNGRQTFGHSLIIDPWGRVLAEAGEKPETITARIDPAACAAARAAIPSLNHDRFAAPPRTARTM